MKRSREKLTLVICLALTLVTLACYWPVTRHGFVSVDDPQYILQNRHVASGLTWAGVGWAFRTGYACNWHPLTWLSHMVDCNLYGLNPGGHHLTNLLLHIADSLFLFLLLRRTTGALWRSAFVAALFAWHPLHVESVAWASERKDVLSAFFFLFTLLCYARYASRSANAGKEKPEIRSPNSEGNPKPEILKPEKVDKQLTASADFGLSSRFYALTLVCFALGLMSKAMLVTTPFVLLLLDYWPLRRFAIKNQKSGIKNLLLEKLPFFALAMAASVVTYVVQKSGRAVASSEALPLSIRCANALVSYLRYLGMTFWPFNLAEIYPFPKHVSFGLVVAGALLLIAGSAFAWRQAKRRPYLATGWFWYVGMLVPTIGLVQVGPQALADRYTYLPSIGLFLVLVWGTNDLVAASLSAIGRPQLKGGPATRFLVWVGAAALAACLATTWFQLKYWQNGETLFRHALAVTRDNGPAWDGLGSALLDMGRSDEALACFSESVRLQPGSMEARYNLGTAELDSGRAEEAVNQLQNVVRTVPMHERAQLNLGCALFKSGRLVDAGIHLSKAVALDPEDPQAHYNYGTILLLQSNIDQAQAELSAAVRLDPGYVSQAVRLDPNDPLLRYNLGTILLMQSQIADAVIQLSEAVRLKPDMEEAHRNLAVALIREGRGPEALGHFSEAARLNPANPEIHFDFGRALLEQHRPAEAAAQLTAGLQLRPDDTNAQYRLAAAQALLRK